MTHPQRVATQKFTKALAQALTEAERDLTPAGTGTPRVWRYDAGPVSNPLNEAFLVSGDLCLAIQSPGREPTKWSVSGSFDEKDTTGERFISWGSEGCPNGKITLSKGRPLAALAREIVRRCLSVYAPARAHHMDALHVRNEAIARDRKNLADLGITENLRDRGCEGDRNLYPNPDDGRWAKLTYYAGGHCKIELNGFSPEQTKVVLAQLGFK